MESFLDDFLKAFAVEEAAVAAPPRVTEHIGD
jgi:hypothetical protein